MIGKHCSSSRFLALLEAGRMAKGAAKRGCRARVLPECWQEGLGFPCASWLSSSLADKLQILHFSSQKCLLREWWLLGYFQKSTSDDYFSVEILTQAIHSSVSHYSRLHFETPIDVGEMKFMWFRLSRSRSG